MISDLEYLESISEASEIVGGAGKDFPKSIKLSTASLTDDILNKVDKTLEKVKVEPKGSGKKVVAYASVKVSKGGKVNTVTKVTS